MNEDNISYNIYYKELMKLKIIDQKIIKKYLKGYKKFGDKKALDIICKSNYRYVASLAYKRLTNKFNVLDLINEGNIGLIEAIEEFDITKNNTFLSFAHSRIDKRIRMFIDTYSSKVHIPYNIVIESNKIKSFINNYEKKYNIIPTIQIITEQTGIKEKLVKKELNYIKNIESSKYLDEDYSISEENSLNILTEYLSFLNDRQKDILNLYFGILNNFTKPIQDIAEKYNTSKEEMEKEIEDIISFLRNLK